RGAATPSSAQMREKYLQSKILKALRSFEGWWVKYHPGPRYGQPGVPDIIGCYQGIFVAMEVKRPREKPTPLQVATIKDIRQLGKGIAVVVTSVDEALAILYAIKRRMKIRSEEHTSELQSRENLVCRLLL